MQFVRQNLFLIIVIAVVLVVGGAMLAMDLSASSNVDKEIAARESLSSRLRRLASAGISSQMVRAEDLRVKSVKEAAKAVTADCIEWNHKNYKVLSVTVDDGADQKVVKAFPVDKQLYEAKGLKFKVTKEYRKRLRAMLTPLKPTRIPTRLEIDKEKQVQKKILMDRAKKDRRRAEAGRDAGADDGRESIEPAAEREATSIMRINKARAGLVYASRDSLDPQFTGATSLSLVPYEDLWKAQLNLWVTSDILAAIRKTNTESVAGVSNPNVLTSGIKHLVKIDVNEDYVTGKAALRRSGSLEDPKKKKLDGEKPAVEAAQDNLTRRVCTKEYDVLHYSFTVVMSTRHLLALQRNLMVRNFHTVLAVELNDLAANTGQLDPLYYYGTDPVMLVTIHGELLLLTAWERGTWEKDKWAEKFPPLIPDESLRTIGPSAQRPEDARRLKKKTGP